MGTKDDSNLTRKPEEEKSVVDKIIDRLEEPTEPVETSTEKPVEEAETPKGETEDEPTAKKPEEETETEDEIVVKANEDIVVTEEIAEAFGLEDEFIGKTVQFSEEEINEVAKSVESENQSGESYDDMEITEELAKTLGLSKTYIGKPLSEAGKAYKGAVSWENENSKQIKSLQKTIEDLVSKLSDKEIDNIESEANREAADTVPDPYDDPKGFSTWLQKRDELIMEKAVKKAVEKVEENPQIKAANELAIKQMQEETVRALKAGLPDEVDALDVMDQWFEENKDDYEDMVETGLYKNKPDKFVRDVLNWYKANSYDSLKKTKESDIRKKVHEKTVANLKAKGNKTKIKYGTSPRGGTTKQDTAVSRILKNLEAELALKNAPK